MYIVTQYATVLSLTFDTQKQVITDPIRISVKIKELLNYKVDKVAMAENLAVSVGGPAISLMISEHALLCQIRINDQVDVGEMELAPADAINEQQLPMIIGLTEIQIEKPSQLVSNNQGSFLMVAN